MNIKNIRRANPVAKDLRTSKYRQKVEPSKKAYSRLVDKKLIFDMKKTYDTSY